MTAPLAPTPDKERIRRNVAKMVSMGATPEEVEVYLRDGEGLEPTGPAKVASAVFAAPDVGVIAPLPRTAPAVGGPIRQGIRSAAQGATFGFADEALGALRGAVEPGQTVRGGIEDERAKLRAGRAQYPVASLASEVAGGAIPALAAGPGRLLSPGGVGTRILEGAAQGGAYGAAYGAGTSDGGLGDRARGALGGAAGGAVVGGAVPVVAEGVKRSATGVRDIFGLRRGAAAAQRGDEKLLEAFRRDNVDPALAADDLLASTKPEIVADVGGKNVQGLTRAVSGRPGPAKERLGRLVEERTAGASERGVRDFERTMGVRRGSVLDGVDEIVTRRGKQAAEQYDRAFQAPPVDSDEIRALLQRPSFQRAWTRAQELAAEEGIPLDAVTPDGPLPVQTLHYVKLALDDLISVGKRAGDEGGLGPSKLRAVSQNKQAFLEALEQAVPEYRTARQTFAGESALRDALEAGTGALRMSDDELAHEFARLTEGEQEMFRRGALDAIRQKLESVSDGGDITKRIFNNSTIRRKLRVLYPDADSWQELRSALARESRMYATDHAVRGNSITFRGQEEMADLARPSFAEGAAQRGVKGELMNRAMGALDRRRQGVVGATADALGQRLMMGGDEAAAYLRQLGATPPADPTQYLLWSRLLGAGTGGAGR